MTLGKRIKAARERLVPEMSQQDVADHFGITDKAVSGWETGASKPSLNKLPKLARKLRVPVAWLLEGPGDPPSPDDLQVRIEALPPGERAVLTTMIDALHSKRGEVA